MIKYYSGYTVSNKDTQKINILKGKNFTLSFEEPLPHTAFMLNSKEVIINAKTTETAVKVTKLIFASLCLLDSHDSVTTEYPPDLTQILDSNKPQKIFENGVGPLWRPDILLACKIACKASYRKKYVYSIFKYRLAASLHSNLVNDLNPNYSSHVSLSPYPDDHLRLGYAIVIFYSILEELGVDIRASNKNPSIINGNWNPIVREDLISRLKGIGIDTNELIYWSMRSTPTIIERKKKPNIIQKSEWAYGDVRDSQIPIEDAISIISFIRSRIAAHNVKDAISSISIYDVSNANFLSRRILLEHMKFFNHI